MWRTFASRYAGTCQRCGESFAAGTRIVWNRNTRYTAHKACQTPEMAGIGWNRRDEWEAPTVSPIVDNKIEYDPMSDKEFQAIMRDLKEHDKMTGRY